MTIFFIIIKCYIDDKIIKLKYCLKNKKTIQDKRPQNKRPQKYPRPVSTGETQPERYVRIV
jgi:hypothetical protein